MREHTDGTDEEVEDPADKGEEGGHTGVGVADDECMMKARLGRWACSYPGVGLDMSSL